LAVSAAVETRRAAEARLRRREQGLRALVSEALVGVAEADATGRFTLVNDRFCALARRSAGELLTMRLQDIFEHEDVDPVAYATNTRQGFVVESRYARPDGSRIWVRSNVSVLTDQEGKVSRIVTIAEDVSARRAEEEDLRRAYDELDNLLAGRTATLEERTGALQAENAKRKRAESVLEREVAAHRSTEDALNESERRFRLFIEAIPDYAFF